MTPFPVAMALIVLALLGACCAAYYAAILWRIIRSARALPTLRHGLALPAPAEWPRVCVVIPAHNEQDVIEVLAGSLLASDYPADRLRLVFSLDRCTDQTEALLRAVLAKQNCGGFGVDVVVIAHCPEGWAGKTHALWRGVQHARSSGTLASDLLLFADADTIFEPGCIKAAVGLLRERNLDLLSLLSTLESREIYEIVVQPAAGFELVRQFPLDLVNRQGSGRAFANGQFMLFRGESYDALGGHEGVKDELLEDLALARKLCWHHKHMRLGVFMAEGLLRCRMYRNWAAFRRGWKRIYIEGVRRKASRLAGFAWRLRIVAVGLPLAAVAGVVAGWMAIDRGDGPLGWSLAVCGASGVTMTVAALATAYRFQGLPIIQAAAYPIGAWMTAGILAEAARDLRAGAGTAWAGKTYAREVRE